MSYLKNREKKCTFIFGSVEVNNTFTILKHMQKSAPFAKLPQKVPTFRQCLKFIHISQLGLLQKRLYLAGGREGGIAGLHNQYVSTEGAISTPPKVRCFKTIATFFTLSVLTSAENDIIIFI